ncbi:MAG: hypothetical protein U1F34_03575 [Gammaproteobacteria bacterium]
MAERASDAGYIPLFARSASISSEHLDLEQSLSRTVPRLNDCEGALRSVVDLQAHAEPFAMMQRERNGALERRRVVETELAQAREAVQHLDAHLRELDQRRHAIETEGNQRREEVEAACLNVAASKFDWRASEQLNAQSTTPEEVLKKPGLRMPTKRSGRICLAELGRKIQRLA